MTLTRIHRRSVTAGPTALLACLFVILGPAAAPAAASEHEPVVDELLALLERRADLDEAVTAAIETAGVQGIDDVQSLAAYLDDLVTWIPTEREIIPKALALYYIVPRRTSSTTTTSSMAGLRISSAHGAHSLTRLRPRQGSSLSHPCPITTWTTISRDPAAG
jgi:hypothetical protein